MDAGPGYSFGCSEGRSISDDEELAVEWGRNMEYE